MIDLPVRAFKSMRRLVRQDQVELVQKQRNVFLRLVRGWKYSAEGELEIKWADPDKNRLSAEILPPCQKQNSKIRID